NNKIVQKNKELFRNGIVIQQIDIEDYIQEADAILIGPGMNRSEKLKVQSEKLPKDLSDVFAIKDEGEQTYYLTKYLLEKYHEKKWIVDAGALQMMDLEDLEKVGRNAIVTPHHQEFERVF